MFKVFAMNILDEVAAKCDSKSRTLKGSKAELLDEVSKDLTNIMLELSRREDSEHQ